MPAGPEIERQRGNPERDQYRVTIGLVKRRLTAGGVASATVGTVGLNAATVGSNFVITFVLSRMIGPRGYGIYAYVLGWVALLGVPAALGITPLVVRSVASYLAKPDWTHLRGLIRWSQRTVLATSAVVVAVAVIVSIVVGAPADRGTRDALYIGFALVPLIAAVSVRQAAMQGLHRVVAARAPESLVQPVIFLGIVALAWVLLDHRLKASWVLLASVGATTTTYVIGSRLLRRAIPSEVRAGEIAYQRHDWRRSIPPLLLLSAAGGVGTNVDTVLLGALKGPESPGVFSVAVRGAGLISFVFFAATLAAGPRIAELYARNLRDELQVLLTRIVRVLLLTATPVVLVFVVFGGRLLAIAGPGFDRGRTALIILCVGEIGNVVLGFNGLVLLMTHNEKLMPWGLAAGSVVNIALAVALISPLGVEGAAIATTANKLFTNVLFAWFLWRRTGLWSAAVGIRLMRNRATRFSA